MLDGANNSTFFLFKSLKYISAVIVLIIGGQCPLSPKMK
jgi:hypothetical protein